MSADIIKSLQQCKIGSLDVKFVVLYIFTMIHIRRVSSLCFGNQHKRSWALTELGLNIHHILSSTFDKKREYQKKPQAT